jgi:hypothetical protein
LDWVFSARQPSVAAGQELITAHLRRHAAPPGAVRFADRIVAQALASVIADDGLVWARLDWEKGQPILSVRTAPDRPLPSNIEALMGGRVWALDEHVDDVRQMFSLGVAAQYALPVSRSREVDVDFDAPDEFRTVSPTDFVGTVAATLVQEAGTGASMLEATTAAGASAGSAAWRAYTDGHGGAAPSNAAEIARVLQQVRWWVLHHRGVGAAGRRRQPEVPFRPRRGGPAQHVPRNSGVARLLSRTSKRKGGGCS